MLNECMNAMLEIIATRTRPCVSSYDNSIPLQTVDLETVQEMDQAADLDPVEPEEEVVGLETALRVSAWPLYWDSGIDHEQSQGER